MVSSQDAIVVWVALPETNSKKLTWNSMVGRWNFRFGGRPILRGELLVSGSIDPMSLLCLVFGSEFILFDGKNPANHQWADGLSHYLQGLYSTCQIMQDFWTINSRKGYLKGWNQAEIHDACQALWSMHFEWFLSACSSSLSAGSSSLIHPKEESSTAWYIFAKASSLFNCHMNLFKCHNDGNLIR